MFFNEAYKYPLPKNNLSGSPFYFAGVLVV